MPQDGCSIPGIISSKIVSKTENWGKKANIPVLCHLWGKCFHSLPLKFPEYHGELRTLNTTPLVYIEPSLISVWKHGLLTELQDTAIYILYNLNGVEHICVYTYTHTNSSIETWNKNLTKVYMLKWSLGQRATRQTCEVLCFAGDWEDSACAFKSGFIL